MKTAMRQKGERSMHLKGIKIIVLIIVIFTITLLLTMLIPIKYCISSLPSDSDEDFYIIRYSLSKRRWLVLGDKTGLFEDTTQERIARIERNSSVFTKIVSVDLYMQGDATTFIVWGTATIGDDWDERYYGDTSNAIRYTISSTNWDVFGKIKSSNWLRNLFPKKYLNIYDYRWFDVLRDRLFGYLDGQSYF